MRSTKKILSKGSKDASFPEPEGSKSRHDEGSSGNSVSRRGFLKYSLAGVGALGVGSLLAERSLGAEKNVPMSSHADPGMSVGISTARQHAQAMDPMTFLTHFDYGKVQRLPDGRTLREYEVVALDKEIEVARNAKFPAWTFNGTVPGPTLRATEGDVMRIHFRNEAAHTHSIHLHGIHPSNMDGVFEQIPPGGSYVYELTAEPFGLFLYHCHTMPVSKHVMKGLYGALVIDPKKPREPAREMVMVMNGFDPDFDEENEFYTVNGIANYYFDYPVRIKVGELVRVYLVNMTEFDFINSLHLHANMFKLYRTGTRLDQYEITDTVMLCQGERSILEFSYKYPGKYIFHAHQNELAERGWLGAFEVGVVS